MSTFLIKLALFSGLVLSQDTTPESIPNKTNEENNEAAMDHIHKVDTSLDGSCVACIGARSIYCVDDSLDFSTGQCLPSFDYCLRPYGFMFFKNCEYTPVLEFAKGQKFTDPVLELEITPEMGQKIKDKCKVTLLNLLFMPNQYQILKVVNNQDIIDPHLYFSGIFDAHKHTPIPDDPRIVN